MQTYIAVDIGASSGRLIKSQLINGQLTLEEIHRFKNGFRQEQGCDRWEIDYLIKEILVGLEKLKKSGITECFVGIDTWAVDYCLLDKQGRRLADPVAYRDARTQNAVSDFAKKIPLQTLYEKTGIQIQPFNTLFQLFVEDPRLLQQADKLLLIPDYLGYVFTGKMAMEKTNASTMQLLNANSQTWDTDLLELLNINSQLFPPLTEAGTLLGELQTEKFANYQLPKTTFITVASHDTASAIIGTPGDSSVDWGYISSGTWSLLGVETTVANVSSAAFSGNYTNEWGAHNTIRFLKNIMGMWLIQEVARMQDYQYSYPELAEQAEKIPAFQQFIAVNDSTFLNPKNMITAIQNYCRKTNQIIPETPAELARCIYDNLALCYALELEKLEKLTGTTDQIKTLHIVGGGANNHLLNQLTADIANITVEAGPSEATAIGNIILQMVTTGAIASIAAGRKLIKASFECQTFKPQSIQPDLLSRYKKFLGGTM
ncbi:rhamnulokinase [Enterococcus sp. PF1-24]|uniref:rhamnulokinase n=1 Tax=unclassified Enterococcus TaxID=2608891 RepID=UPI0024751BC7|nr:MULTISPECIES: rhamnulokinase [unclassified Enterococcus]MDH6364357.1 rhamnulokinase [Enterococcus sp. PFB1-1]MDH6401454.1 rhamnulokinase [Enterococcus sp. PF1-24]